MARFANGWVAISRRIFNPEEQANEFHGDLPLIGVWIIIICWANVRETKTRGGRDAIKVPRGSLVTSQAEIGDYLGIGRTTVRRCLEYLERTQRINQVANQHGTLITVLNYDQYQKSGLVDIQASDQSPTSTRPAPDQQATNGQPPIEQGDKGTKGQDDKTSKGASRAQRQAAYQKGIAGKSTATWNAYHSAYLLVHGVEPLRPAQVSAQLCRFVDLVGEADAPEVAEWYLNDRDARVMANRHPIDHLVRNFQKYHSDWQKRESITRAKARTIERDDHNRSAVDSFLADRRAQTAGGSQ